MNQTLSTNLTLNERISFYESIGKRIRIFRNFHDKSQSDVAKVLGITFQQFQKYEIGKNRISIEQLFKLCRFFNVEITDFFTDCVSFKFKVLD
jgi:transcriptional regulator with XRE-family HTH domain